MRAAVVGHVEWVEFVRVEKIPAPGDIVHAREWWAEPAGGGPGAASQLMKLAGEATFFTALGNDDLGHRAERELMERGLHVEAAFRDVPTRRAISYVDARGERTITVLGERLGPHASDPLKWELLEHTDTAYFTAGNVESLRSARRARILVATARVLPWLQEAGVELDALVGSAVDPAERFEVGALEPQPKLLVWTDGERGGDYLVRGQQVRRYPPAAPPGPIVDRYGAGDSFAGGLAYGLAAEEDYESAIGIASRCGAAALTGRGPYEGQLDRDAIR
jgi:ribokinase